MKRKLFLLLAWIFVLLGAIGIAIPILPTTPFLLLSVWLFSKSSQRFHEWILNHKILGEYVRSYKNREGIPVKIKIRTILLLWLTIFISMYFVQDKIGLVIMLFVIAVLVSVHIIMIKGKIER
ncbi:MAG: YbaN family protein [Bacteroidales bacterium]|nr:YbaN family protein [Bacteroidales bacterium]